MSTITCTRRLELDAGHRLINHGGKCQNTHGHRYRFDITCEAAEGGLDEVGRVVDFSEIKRLVGTWLDENWDHGFIYQDGDPIGEAVKEAGQKVYCLACPPTAENLADIVRLTARDMLAEVGIKVVNVRCWETPNCWADAS